MLSSILPLSCGPRSALEFSLLSLSSFCTLKTKYKSRSFLYATYSVYRAKGRNLLFAGLLFALFHSSCLLKRIKFLCSCSFLHIWEDLRALIPLYIVFVVWRHLHTTPNGSHTCYLCVFSSFPVWLAGLYAIFGGHAWRLFVVLPKSSFF